MRPLCNQKTWPWLTGCLLIGSHYLIFSQFLPNKQGLLGIDYGYKLPLLLDGYYWILQNGIFSLPCFTPSFCGGIPRMANPQSVYVSTLQLFTFFTDPLRSVQLTFLLFAALGFWGCYLLLRRRFATGVWTAILGATLFLFNGFYTYRFIIGHAEFHPFMLLPLLAFFLLAAKTGPDRLGRWQEAGGIVASALLISYMLWAGMLQLLLPSLLAVLAVGLVHNLPGQWGGSPQVGLFRFCRRLALAVSLGLCLSAAKLAATFTFLHYFPREIYPLPGVAGFAKLFGLLGEVLFWGGSRVVSAAILTNFQWDLERHEFEYGLSLVPLLIMGGHFLVSLVQSVASAKKACPRTRPTAREASVIGLLLCLLALPVLLNYYSPAWNHFLKSLPIIRKLSNILRWFTIYIPFLVVVTALIVKRLEGARTLYPVLVTGSLALIIGQNLFIEKDFYQAQPYDPSAIVEAYAAAKGAGVPPVIAEMVATQDAQGEAIMAMNGNDALVAGGSQLMCYEPMFGYNLEAMPFKTIHPGPALADDGSTFNIKNPACYLYPEENNCQPGDQFLLSQRQEVEDFIHFRPFAYKISLIQKVANAVNSLALSLVCFFGLSAGVLAAIKKIGAWGGGSPSPCP